MEESGRMARNEEERAVMPSDSETRVAISYVL
jgi:hypothetical protein